MRTAHHYALLLLLLLGACRTVQSVDEAAMVRTELFFGLSRPDGGAISEPVWQSFIDEIVTPRFPQGFSVVDANGQWRDKSGKITHERSKILLILHDPDPRTRQKLEEIRAEYKRRFDQESVLRESSDVKVAF